MERKKKLTDNLSYLEADVPDKSETVSKDYKPYYDYKIGFLDEQYVPVYGYLNFGYLPNASKYYMFKDSKGREVLLFKGSQGKPVTDSFFRAYRYDKNDDFIYDNEPLSTPFMTSNQRIDYIDYCTNNYIVAKIKTVEATTSTNYYLIKTNSSYDTNQWQNVLDISATVGFNTSTYNSIAIDEKENKLYVIASENTNGGLTEYGIIKLKIYDLNTGSFINEYSLFDMNIDLNMSKYPTATKRLAHGGVGAVFNFNTGDLLISLKTLVYYEINGRETYISKNVYLSLNLSDTLRSTGTGSYSYYIPINSTNYDFFNNGIGIGSKGVYGRHDGFSFNSYDNSIYYTERSTWIDWGFDLKHLKFDHPLTFSGVFLDDLSEVYSTQRHNVPDSSPWSKACFKKAIITDDYFIGYGRSTKYGVTYFITRYDIVGNDISFISGQWRILNDVNSNPSIDLTQLNRWFIHKNGTTVDYYSHDSSFKVHKINIDNNFNITYTDMNFTLPLPNSSLYSRQNQWAVDFTNNKVYWVVVDRNDQNKAKIIWTGDNGSTWNLGPVLNSGRASESVSQFGDGNARPNSGSSSNMFMENNYVYVNYTYRSFIGSFYSVYERYDSTTNSLITYSNYINPYEGGYTLGYNSRINYYTSKATVSYYSMEYDTQSSLENLLNETSISKLYTTVSTSSGLGATLLNFPVFLDGYYYQTPTTDVELVANSDNYIYLETVDEENISVFASTSQLNNTETRIMIAKVTTDDANPISQELYDLSFNETTEPKYVFKKIKLENVFLSQNSSITIKASNYGLEDFIGYKVMDYMVDESGNYIVNNNVKYTLSFDKTTLQITSLEDNTNNFTFMIMVYMGRIT